jgi:hypothetical protein
VVRRSPTSAVHSDFQKIAERDFLAEVVHSPNKLLYSGMTRDRK